MASKIVLLIEDNRGDDRLTFRTLCKNNIMDEEVIACGGDEAVRFLYSVGAIATPSLIVIDLEMPSKWGFDLLERIRAESSTAHVPIVVLTQSGDIPDVVRAYSKGANSYIAKPIDPKSYEEIITQMLMYWLLLNEPSPGRV